MSLRMRVVLDLIVIRGAAAIFVHRWRPGAAQKSRCHRNSTVCIQMYAWDPWTRLNGPEVLQTFRSPGWLSNVYMVYKPGKFSFICFRHSNHFKKSSPPSRISKRNTCAKLEGAATSSCTYSKQNLRLRKSKPRFLEERALVSTSGFRHWTQWPLTYLVQDGP